MVKKIFIVVVSVLISANAFAKLGHQEHIEFNNHTKRAITLQFYPGIQKNIRYPAVEQWKQADGSYQAYIWPGQKGVTITMATIKPFGGTNVKNGKGTYAFTIGVANEQGGIEHYYLSYAQGYADRGKITWDSKRAWHEAQDAAVKNAEEAARNIPGQGPHMHANNILKYNTYSPVLMHRWEFLVSTMCNTRLQEGSSIIIRPANPDSPYVGMAVGFYDRF